MYKRQVLKKAVGEDTLIYEKKGQDAIHFHSYAKLLFSTNEMPQNLEDKSDAFYRRLLILDMNRVVKSGEKDLHLKEKVQACLLYTSLVRTACLERCFQSCYLWICEPALWRDFISTDTWRGETGI